jgi:hypothetical protein
MKSRITLAAIVALVASAAAAPARAVTFGWRELQDGGFEYIVQVEPALVDAFREKGFSSYIPKDVPKFSHITLKIGEEKLPNEGTLPPPPVAPEPRQKIAEPDPMASVPSVPKGEEPASGERLTEFQAPPNAKPIDINPFSSAFNRKEVPTTIDPTPPAASNPPVAETAKEPPLAKDENKGEPVKTDKPVIETESAAGTSRPWMPLMLTLVALFASIGANAYLVWIHQTLRMNYQAVVNRMKGDSAAA